MTLFFITANIIGGYTLLQMVKGARRHWDALRQVRDLNLRLEIEMRNKEEANRRLEHLSVTDPLTEVANRRKFMTALNQEQGRSERTGLPFSTLILDIDHFKLVNDRHGHDVGDLVLREVARATQSRLRGIDLLARLGGEEFGVILPDTESAGAYVVAERIREHIASVIVPIPGGEVRVTVSIGVGQLRTGRNDSTEALLKRTDQALYSAKTAGRNRTLTDTKIPGPEEGSSGGSPGRTSEGLDS